MHREPILWRPADEPAAASNRTAFIEWLRATGRPGGADPATLAARRQREPAAFLGDIAAFLALDPAAGWAGNLRRGRDAREAVVRGGRSWSRDVLTTDDDAWREAAGARADGSFAMLVPVAAAHLLDTETRPDDRLSWEGDPGDPFPWGCLLFGATLVLRG